MERDHVAHLAGVFDVVGSVTAQLTKTEDTRIGFRFHPLIRINRPEDQEVLMGKLDAYCEDYDVDHSITKRSDSGSFVFEAKSPEGIRNFLMPMMDYLVVNHEEAIIMLEEILPRVEDDLHLTEDGLIEIMGYVDRLRETSRYGAEAKYTQSYFEDLWNAEEN
ncbi:HNH endonuclease [Halorubrum tailed phage 7]|uniref:HNH endonuclease n=1 Tax=Halorubrum tailed phage 7 TaxID=2847108 RepID=UPI000334827A|nr:HNH endonuclease [Halorubrum tailed phage 7]AGM10941.1 hypothetical protein HRTV7_70 [Halorubrum tailed phage 7]